MKTRVSLFGIMLCVCVVVAPGQAQTLTATGPYVAVTDRTAYPKPPLPALGPAGTTITDPVFQSPITRMTDAATRPGHLNYSFRTTSSPHQNEWSANGSYFYVISDDGTVIPFRFDEATGTATRINPTSSGNGGMTLLTYVEPQFSYVNDSIIYVGYSGSGTNNRTIDEYDFSTNLYTTLVNLDTVVTGLSGTYIGGIASSGGSTERVETFFGGTSQDHHHYVLVFDRNNPSNRLLLDTWASTINGVPTPITLNFSLHHAAIDRSGRYVMLYTTYADQTGTRQAPQSYVWDTETGSLFAMVDAVHPYGHDALGYGVSVNADCCTSSTWDAAQWQFRSLAAPAVTRDILPIVLSPKEVYLADHTTWNDASPTALVPYISATYRYGDNTVAWRALDDEIVAIETDVPGANPTIWRFAHHRSNVASDINATAESFWYEPRPNVSDDGKWVLFTSNWEKTLGTDPAGDSATMARQDVFLVKLTTTGSTSTNAVRISSAALPTGRQDTFYTGTLQASGGSGTYMWSVSSGALPSGLSLDAATGIISGTPPASGSSTLTVSVADGADATDTASATVSIVISGVLPAGWNDQDVGATGAAGSVLYSSGVFTVQGAGADVWGTSDALHYVYVPLAGDGSIVARVASVSNQASWVKAGVMIRGSLDPSSAEAFMLVSYAKGVAFQRRTFDANTSVSTSGSASTAPRWVKLVRSGSTISAYESADGATWTLVGSDTFTMPTNAFVGLAVSSHVYGTLATATFDNVSVSLPNIPPSVTITSPAAGSTFTAPASIIVSASASDTDGTIAKVDFYANAALIATVGAAPYTITWSNVPAGTYSLTAVATDNAGASTTSAAVGSVTVSLPDSPPSVTITSPTGGSSYTAPASVIVSASASDTDGTIAKVDFYANATLIATAAASPYTVSWTNVPAGTYSLTAVATDNAGASTTSASVSVTINASIIGSALPAGWSESDIGNPPLPGSTTYSAGTFSVTGSGADIWSTSDAFHYVYTSLTGDGTIVARVASIQNVSTSVKAGVMIRGTLGANSVNAFMLVSASRGVMFQRREATGRKTVSTAGSGASAPHWVKLTRSGNTFTAYESNDGTAWVTVGTDTIEMGATVYIGLAVTSHSTSASATCTFDSVTIQ